MADKAIGDLEPITTVNDSSKLVLEYSNTAYYITGYNFTSQMASLLDGHGGISSVELTSTSGTTKTYTITYADHTTSSFTMEDGNGIESYSITYQTSSSGTAIPQGTWMRNIPAVSNQNPFLWTRVVLTDSAGANTTFYSVGGRGEKGDQTYVHIKWAARNPQADSDLETEPDDYMGICTSLSSSAPTTYSSYAWYKIKGDNQYVHIKWGTSATPAVLLDVPDEYIGIYAGPSESAPATYIDYAWYRYKGDTGDPAIPTNTVNEYAYSTSQQPTTFYSSVAAARTAWINAGHADTQGAYLWTHFIFNWNNGSHSDGYSAAYQGINGDGASGIVTSVHSSDTGNDFEPLDGVVTLSGSGLGLIVDPEVKITGQALMYDENVGWYAGDTASGLTFDNAPVSGSNNPVKSGGIYTALQGKVDTASLTNGDVTKVGTSTVGSSSKPIYLNAGVPRAITGDLAVADGGTGASTASAARTNLGAQAQHNVLSPPISIAANEWANNSVTKNATGVTTSNTVIVSPAPASFVDYGKSLIYCSAQGNGTLTFECETTPTSTITVNVLILD